MDTTTATKPDQQTAPPQPQVIDDDEQVFLIPLLVGVLRWIEELIVALSGYGIVFALAIGVIDLLTNGNLTAQWPWIDFAYAVSFAGAIAGQIIGLASRSSRSFGRGQWLRGSAYTALVLLLAFTEYQSTVVYGIHRAFGTPVAEVLLNIGLTQQGFIQLRALVGVFLAVLSGYLRYQKPTRRKSVAQLEQEADEAIRLAEIQRKKRAAMFGNVAALVGDAAKSAREATVNALADTNHQTENTGAPASPVQGRTAERDASSGLAKLPQDYRPNDSAFARYELPNGMTLESELSLSEMAQRLGIAKSLLSTKWRDLEMDYEPAHGDQPPTTMNVRCFQVLALVETGEIRVPDHVRVLQTIS